MTDPGKVLIVQTAFLGDVILTVPLAESIRREFKSAPIDIAVIPEAAPLLQGHPAFRKVIVFDKRGKDSGLKGLLRVARQLRNERYTTAIVPHRSMRSALLVRCAGIPKRIGFHTSAGKWLLTDIVRYEATRHEMQRNCDLLSPFGATGTPLQPPALYPSAEDKQLASRFLASHGINPERMVCLAPGTVWNTKKWLPERYAELAIRIVKRGYSVVLIGGSADKEICTTMEQKGIVSAAGALSLLQSASVMSHAAVLVSNDSAPVHLAGAVRTPVIAIFGATVPSFGFAPLGPRDTVIEMAGLECRPCGIHGGNQCPISTFVCMKDITVDRVFRAVLEYLTTSEGRVDGAVRLRG
jgi:heptosyltransferase-2